MGERELSESKRKYTTLSLRPTITKNNKEKIHSILKEISLTKKRLCHVKVGLTFCPLSSQSYFNININSAQQITIRMTKIKISKSQNY